MFLDRSLALRLTGSDTLSASATAIVISEQINDRLID